MLSLVRDAELQLLETWSRVRRVVGRDWHCHGTLRAKRSGEAENREVCLPKNTNSDPLTYC